MSRANTVRAGLWVTGVACLALGVAIWLHDTSAAPGPRSPAGPPAPTESESRHPPAQRARCDAPTNPFRPATVSVAGVTRSLPVVAVHRDDSGVPGVPPLTDAGKHEFAWDRAGIRPGDRHGHVLMNAHTWPDGSALGNTLLSHLHVDDLIVVRGAHGAHQCYRVTQRLDVPFPNTPRRVVSRYYATTGRPRLALVACSGRRIGPGDWTRRTLWFARPVTRG